MSSKPTALARAFTKRTKRPEAITPIPAREGSVRYAPGTIQRTKISLPTELLSTTNVQALNAPDIRHVSASSSNSSLRSADDSDFSHISRSFIESPGTTPDSSSIESSPVTPDDMGHSTFFDQSKTKRSVTSVSTTRSAASSVQSAPLVPQRALSHSKHAHQEMSRNRSISRMSPPPTTLMPAVNVVRDSTAFFNGSVESAHPFGNELARVNEVAEGFGGISSVLDEEEELLLSKGLCKFGVEDYINEIQGLYGGIYEDRLTDAWI